MLRKLKCNCAWDWLRDPEKRFRGHVSDPLQAELQGLELAVAALLKRVAGSEPGDMCPHKVEQWLPESPWQEPSGQSNCEAALGK